MCNCHRSTLSVTQRKSTVKCMWTDEAVTQICGTEIAEMWSRDIDPFPIDLNFLFPTFKVSLEIFICKLPKTRKTCQPRHVGIICIWQPQCVPPTGVSHLNGSYVLRISHHWIYYQSYLVPITCVQVSRKVCIHNRTFCLLVWILPATERLWMEGPERPAVRAV